MREPDQPLPTQQGVFDAESHNAIVEQIAAWGQLAIWENNEAELERVRHWIRRALARDDAGSQLAYEHYRSCTFRHRLSLLAVLHGRTSLLEYEAGSRYAE